MTKLRQPSAPRPTSIEVNKFSMKGNRLLRRPRDIGKDSRIVRLVQSGAEMAPFGTAPICLRRSLHRPQNADGDHVRYSGSPLAVGFDEAGSRASSLPWSILPPMGL